MVSIATIARVDLVLGSIASLLLLYLLYSGSTVVQYKRFFRLIALGLLIYAVTGPVFGILLPAYIHAIHGIAALCISLGLWDLVRGDLHRESDLSALFVEGRGFEPTDLAGGEDGP